MDVFMKRPHVQSVNGHISTKHRSRKKNIPYVTKSLRSDSGSKTIESMKDSLVWLSFAYKFQTIMDKFSSNYLIYEFLSYQIFALTVKLHRN